MGHFTLWWRGRGNQLNGGFTSLVLVPAKLLVSKDFSSNSQNRRPFTVKGEGGALFISGKFEDTSGIRFSQSLVFVLVTETALNNDLYTSIKSETITTLEDYCSIPSNVHIKVKTVQYCETCTISLYVTRYSVPTTHVPISYKTRRFAELILRMICRSSV